MQAKIITPKTLLTLQACLDIQDFCDVISIQAIMNSLPVNPEDYYSSSTTFSERCLEHFCKVYLAPTKRSAFAMCRLLACQEFDATPMVGFALLDAKVALKQILIAHEKASRASFELVQLRRANAII